MHWPRGKHCRPRLEEPDGNEEVDQVRPRLLVTKALAVLEKTLVTRSEQVAAVEQDRPTPPRGPVAPFSPGSLVILYNDETKLGAGRFTQVSAVTN